MSRYVFLLLAVGMVPREAHAAIVYGAVADFSTTTNTDESTWSYRSGTTLLPDFNVIPSTWDPDVGQWHIGSSVVPGIGVNDTGSTVAFTGNLDTFSWANNTMWMHPGNGVSVELSWLSPSDGVLDLSFSFADMDFNGGDGIAWSVELNDSGGVIDSGTFANGGSTMGVISHNNISISAGDRINFVVSPNGSHSFDSTTVSATVELSAVPEPSTLTLLSIAVIGFADYLWRKRRKRS